MGLIMSFNFLRWRFRTSLLVDALASPPFCTFAVSGATTLRGNIYSHGYWDLGNIKSVASVAVAFNVKLTWLALGEDHAARSRRVEQLIAL